MVKICQHFQLYNAFQNLPRLGFFVCKYTIWQPCLQAAVNVTLHICIVIVLSEERYKKGRARLAHGCQIFLDKTYQNGKNISNYHKLSQMTIKKPISRKIFQITIKYSSIIALALPNVHTQNWIIFLKICHLAILVWHPKNIAF
jgi:hypothetical protein